MKFDWKRFRDEKIAVLCKTEDEAKDFIRMAFKNGLCWVSHGSKDTFWRGEPKSYIWSRILSHAEPIWFESKGYETLEWSDYMRPTRKQLKERIACLESDLSNAEYRLGKAATQIKAQRETIDQQKAARLEKRKVTGELHKKIRSLEKRLANPYMLIAEKTPLSEEAVRDAIAKLVSEDQLKAPYDKNGDEIKAGCWANLEGFTSKPFKVSEVSEFIGDDGRQRFRIQPEEGRSWVWSKEAVSSKADLWEVVPEPDSVERIKSDVDKVATLYWGCADTPCAVCPSCFDGKKPREYYKVVSCIDAKTLDLIARTEAVMRGGA